MKHTLGPWTTKDRIVYKDNKRICECGVIFEGNWKPRFEEQEANARLIAAAPDLLEACKKVFKYTCGRNDGTSKRLRICVEQAIAKAEGK